MSYLVTKSYVITEDGQLIPINSDEYKRLKQLNEDDYYD